MSERRPVSLSERWRREATRDIDEERLNEAVETMPTIRQSLVRINKGSVHAELEGLMGSIHEVNIHAPVLPTNSVNPRTSLAVPAAHRVQSSSSPRLACPRPNRPTGHARHWPLPASTSA